MNMHTHQHVHQFPNVPTSLPAKGKLPEDYRLGVYGWSFPVERIGEFINVHGRRIKPMLAMDINIPRDDFAEDVNSGKTPLEIMSLFANNFPCPHGCANCFNNAKLRNPVLRFDEVKNVIIQAKELGTESSKFLGPGELFANPRLFEILDLFADLNIVFGIFTKGAILGNDMLSNRYLGINSDELVRRVTAYPNTTFLVGGRSFDPTFENKLVPQNKREVKETFDYHKSRNLAIERLCQAGMNSDLARQRLAIACAPVTADNISGAFEIFIWGAERNIPVYLPPTMVSGKGRKFVAPARDVNFENAYIDLAVNVYVWAIKRGVVSLDCLLDKADGVHPYLGLVPCNQLTHGMYIHIDGSVRRCPGNDMPEFTIHSNVREKPLIDIWTDSVNYRTNLFNNRCVKDGFSLPRRFYSEVFERVKKQLGD